MQGLTGGNGSFISKKDFDMGGTVYLAAHCPGLHGKGIVSQMSAEWYCKDPIEQAYITVITWGFVTTGKVRIEQDGKVYYF